MLWLLKAWSHSSSNHNLNIFKWFYAYRVSNVPYKHQHWKVRCTDVTWEKVCRQLLDIFQVLFFWIWAKLFWFWSRLFFSISVFSAGGCLRWCYFLSPLFFLATSCRACCGTSPPLQALAAKSRSHRKWWIHEASRIHEFSATNQIQGWFEICLWMRERSGVLGFSVICLGVYFGFSWEACKSKRFIQKSFSRFYVVMMVPVAFFVCLKIYVNANFSNLRAKGSWSFSKFS